MDSRIVNISRSDVVMIESRPRPTPTPTRVSFGQVLSAGVSGVVQGAELVASKLPGSPITAAAVRGGMTTMSAPVTGLAGLAANAAAEGPVGVGMGSGVAGMGIAGVGSGGGGTTGDSAGGIDSTLQQSAQLNLYYLQLQQEVDAQNRMFTALSNILKTEHDSAKGAIGNIHS